MIAGVGASYLDLNAAQAAVADPERRSMIADALLADDVSTITNETARNFRLFADQPGKDRLALAACMRGSRDVFTREQTQPFGAAGARGLRRKGCSDGSA
ncbi:MAG: hypothetical protein WDM89_00285 [Rhizomicrobium sp.]